MSRTGLYWTDDRDRLNCAHGVILHGTKCINCERGDIPDTLTAHERAAGSRRFMFDTASGPDRTATGTYQRVGDTMRFTVDDIETDYSWRDEVERRTKAAHEKINEALRRSAGGRDYYTVPPFVWPHSKGDPRPRPEHWNCRSRIDPTWGDGTPMTDDEADLMNGRYRGAEVITDASDTRGVNARRVGPGR